MTFSHEANEMHEQEARIELRARQEEDAHEQDEAMEEARCDADDNARFVEEKVDK